MTDLRLVLDPKNDQKKVFQSIFFLLNSNIFAFGGHQVTFEILDNFKRLLTKNEGVFKRPLGTQKVLKGF